MSYADNERFLVRFRGTSIWHVIASWSAEDDVYQLLCGPKVTASQIHEWQPINAPDLTRCQTCVDQQLSKKKP